MACELPVVVTDSGDNRNWIKDGKNGFIVPTTNPNKLAKKIIYLLKQPNMRKDFGRINRGIVQDRAHYQKEMEKMEKLYQEVTSKKR